MALFPPSKTPSSCFTNLFDPRLSSETRYPLQVQLCLFLCLCLSSGHVRLSKILMTFPIVASHFILSFLSLFPPSFPSNLTYC
ncbi:unnamed protein product [Fusarium venenatum]|uniref:Uncharacterized protein n=1 Tax=Fusarium venenatum TaxID=56646 RepID=A0A2L2TJI5_9HYPO|nr:uncharacterized protein FVRRES_13208 [Fusarium venenatum]CEI40643.1 unnamed protein product [Fusarium venenatum]